MATAVPKLYTVYSVVNNFHNRDNVTFSWGVRKRRKPVADYSLLIRDYDAMVAEEEKARMRQRVDALFTDREVRSLRGYLQRRHDAEIFVKRVKLPVSRRGGELPPLGWESARPGTGHYMLSREKGYNLAAEIWATYDLRECPLTAEEQLRRRERAPGVQFLRRALSLLGVEEGLDPARIDRAVATLYDQFGYRVEAAADPATGSARTPKPPKSRS